MGISQRPAKHARPRSTAARPAIPVTRSVSASASGSKKASATSRRWRSCARRGTVEQRVSASCSRLPQPPTISCESRSSWRPYHDEGRKPSSSRMAGSHPDPVKPAKSAIGGFFRSLLALTKRLWKESIMEAIAVAVSAAAIAAMVAVVGSGQMALVAADGELKAEAVADTNGNLHVPNGYRTTYE